MKAAARILLLLVLLPQLLGLGLAVELVVCLAPDGHVEIELASSDCCRELPAEDAHPDGEPERDDGCGPCRDLPIPLDPEVESTLAPAAHAGPAPAPMLALELPGVLDLAAPRLEGAWIRATGAPDPVTRAPFLVLRT